MTIALFEFDQHQRSLPIVLSSPKTIMETRCLDRVIPLLEAAEAEAFGGNFVALMLSYEAAPAFDSALKTHDSSPLPLAWAGVFPRLSLEADKRSRSCAFSQWKPGIDRVEYDSAITKIRDLITIGQTYQVNFSFPLKADFEGDAFGCYHDLRIAQGARYSAFLDLGTHQILSLSPELFFKRTGDAVRTRPMKGTVRRGRWSEEDEELKAWLENSLKDKAENVMIVDLLRNDLGKVSIPGSVKVSSLFELERFETVWQMTSTVESTLRPGTSLVELMAALFPCGSVTGAPKIRTMEIIRELEPNSRGVYTGTIGLLYPGGDCVFNVAIRTVVVDSETGQATFGVGGGVTIDSTAVSEYEECLVKARFLNTKPRSFHLFESMLIEDGNCFLLERHLARLRSSAEFFAFEFPESRVMSVIDELRMKHHEGKWKAKLTLAQDGMISTQVTRLEPPKDWRVGLASLPVDPSDRLLFHKTTQRNFYLSELQARPDCDDLLFFNDKGELTESSMANVVLRLNGKLVTPQISAGLLAGTFRDQLIADGEIEERRITVEELKAATEVFLINSVRKWIRAVLFES